MFTVVELARAEPEHKHSETSKRSTGIAKRSRRIEESLQPDRSTAYAAMAGYLADHGNLIAGPELPACG
jgi:hypothetical protein